MKRKGIWDCWHFEDMNEIQRGRDPRYVQGFVDACNMVNDWRGAFPGSHVLLGDAVLAKKNLISTRQVRKNKKPCPDQREGKVLSLAELRRANTERNKEWDSGGKLDVTFRGLEFAGEAGEVCNKLKKLERERRGLRGSRATREELADELADAIITADLIGMMEAINLSEAVVRVFNRKSDELNLQTHLSVSPEDFSSDADFLKAVWYDVLRRLDGRGDRYGGPPHPECL